MFEDRNNNIAYDEAYIDQIVKKLPINEACKMSILHYALYALRQTRRTKCLYYFFTGITIIAPIIVLTLNSVFTKLNFENGFYITSIITFSSSVAAALLSLRRYHEHWLRNRDYLEAMIATMIEAIKETNQEEEVFNQNFQSKLMDKIIELSQKNQTRWANERKQQANLSNKQP